MVISTLKFQTFNGLTALFKPINFQVILKRLIERLLKCKSGICLVRAERIVSDQYGKKTSVFDIIGKIDLDELNRYDNWTYWAKQGGIALLFYNFYIKGSNIVSIIGSEIDDNTNKSTIIDTSIQRYQYDTDAIKATN